MKKIDTARKIIGQGNCLGISCKECFHSKKEQNVYVCKSPKEGELSLVKKAEAYEKRYARPKKDKAETDQTPERTPLDIAKMIRDNGYDCKRIDIDIDVDANYILCEECPLDNVEKCGSGKHKNSELFKLRKKLIDDYILANDHIRDTTKKVEQVEKKYVRCVGGANGLTIGKVYEVMTDEDESKYLLIDDDGYKGLAYKHRFEDVKESFTEPQPLSFDDPVPEYAYWLEENQIIRKKVIEFVQKRYRSGNSDTFALVEGGQEPYLKNLYKTPEDAVQVAKKLWEVEQ